MLISVFLFIFAMHHAPVDLNGVWDSPNGEKYYINQIDRDIWSIEDSAIDADKSAAAYGEIKDKKVTLTFTEVPDNSQMRVGTTLELDVISKNKMLMTKMDGEPVHIEWKRE